MEAVFVSVDTINFAEKNKAPNKVKENLASLQAQAVAIHKTHNGDSPIDIELKPLWAAISVGSITAWKFVTGWMPF